MSMSIKKLFSTKKAVVVGSAIALTLGLSGAAFAFFTATGSGSGTGSVGSTTAWTVNNPTPTGDALYPGVGSQTFAFTVTNNATGNQGLVSVTATVAPHNGCDASWYDVQIDAGTATPTTATETYGSPINIAPGNNQAVSVVLTLTNQPVDQSACEGDAPVVTLTAN